MKKRPGKKITIDPMRQAPFDKGFNSCHDAHTEWLPDAKEISGIVAQGYCTDKNKNKILDPDLCEAIVEAIRKRLE